MTLNEKLTKIQTEFKSKKSRFNSFGKYYFRSAEDILEATKPFLKELGVTVTIHEELLTMKPGSCDQPVLRTTATISDDENSIAATAIVGVDVDQKGMQMPQRYGAASSYGKKYALGNLFLLDDTKDADSNKTQAVTKKVMTEEQFTKAKEYVSNGGEVQAIVNKYEVTVEQVVELKAIKG